MDARLADIAFVLEEAGALAAYRIRSGSKASANFDFAVHVARGRPLAAASYHLLRVLRHDDLARVYFFFDEAPSIILEGAESLSLDARDRELARARVRPPTSEEAFILQPGEQYVILFSEDEGIVAAVRQSGVRYGRVRSFGDLVASRLDHPCGTIFIDEALAFGADGVLAKLDMNVANECYVLVSANRYVDARWRLQGDGRILRKPLESWMVRARLNYHPPIPAVDRAAVTETVARRVAWLPAPDQPFQALLVAPPTDLEPALRRIVRHDSRIVVVPDVESGVKQIFSAPFHFIACGANAALPPRSLIDAVGREDRAAAERILVTAPHDDVAYTRWKLERMNAKNVVVPSPVDEVWLGRRIFEANPALGEALAVKDLDADPLAPPPSHAFRRKTMLVVDDEPSTAILFAARTPTTEAYDLVYAESAMQAFEIVTSRPIDALLVSAKLRNEGNEPFYRVLWRLHPALKASTLLLVDSETAGPLSASGRIVERPLRRDELEAITRRL